MTTDIIHGCPICFLTDFLDIEREYTTPNDEQVMASICCGECHIQVSADTLQKAVDKWNSLSTNVTT